MFKVVRQHEIRDCSAACLSMICKYYNLHLPMAQIRDLIKVDNNGANIYGIVKASRELGLEAVALNGSKNDLCKAINEHEVKSPFIARIIADGLLEHYIVVFKITKNKIIVGDPAKGKVIYTYDDFFEVWTGHIISFEKTERFVEKNECKGSLMRFIKVVINEKKLLISICAVTIIITSLSIIGVLTFKVIIDGIDNNSIAHGFNGYSIAFISIALIALYVFEACMEMIRGVLLAQLSKRIETNIFKNYYNHIIDLPLRILDSRKTGEILSRFSDASNINELLSGVSLSLVLDTSMVIVCVFVLMTLNFEMFVIAFVTMLIYAIVILCFIRPIENINRIIMEANAEVTSYLKESIDGIITIKAFDAEDKVKSKAFKKLKKFINSNVKGDIIYTAQEAITGLVASVGIIFVLWSGVVFVINGEITIGTMITFYALMGYFLEPVQRLLDLQPELQTALVAADRLNDFLDIEIENTNDNSVDRDNGILIEKVDFRYGNRNLVLKNVNMEINPGECIAIVGESGSGKTTLAKLIMGFYKPEQGIIRIGKKNGSLKTLNQLREDIAYISQDIFLFSDTIENNLKLGNDCATMEQIEEACRISKADVFINNLPRKYETILGENGTSISGGEKQRIAIARALLKKPKILIMDEATSNLDSITEESIKQTIDSLRGKVTCIIIAHRLSTIKNCDYIYVMKDGQIVEKGSHMELIDKAGIYKELYTGRNN